MAVLLTIIIFLVVFSLIVLVHEFGHFIMARRAGIQVEEFGIGLPPRLIGFKSKRIKGLIWSVNLIPFGGFVRMLGEDSSDAKVLKNPASFASKSIGKRFSVVIAGVVMNFLLAFVLLIIGFSVGIEPLMVTSQDFLDNLNQNRIILQAGAVINEVPENSLGYEAGFRGGDELISLNGQTVTDPAVWEFFFKNPIEKVSVVSILRDGKQKKEIAVNISNGQSLKVKLYNLVVLPKLAVQEVKLLSTSYYAGLKKGDIITQVNGHQVYQPEDLYQETVNSKEVVTYRIIRDHVEKDVKIPLQKDSRTVITEILPDSVASKSGFMVGDILLEINGEDVIVASDTRSIMQKRANDQITYKVERNGEIKTMTVQVPNTGYIGILLSTITPYRNNHVSVYTQNTMFSVLDIAKIKYSIYEAPLKVLGEMKRLSILTVKMFGQVLGKIIGEGKVPEGVAGPVGIAQMTYVFMQEGFAALIRFAALLSLSLGVINVLPLPALDGGRLAFIILEGIRGRSINAKWESRIHAVGFVLLIILILVVTYNDILRVIHL